MDVPQNLLDGDLEVVAQRLDVDNDVVDRALKVVRQFISDKGLILYGGLAIDYTLRLKGGHIYPEGERPDYDMLSPNNVEHAYELADILAGMGFPAVQAIPALHVQTMKVRVNIIVVADISFVPEGLFKALPTVEYADGPPIRVIHPHWQFMDQHLAFCFPFRDPPREPVFHRFKKDLKRFNILQSKYPLPRPSSGGETRPARITIPLLEHCALYGDPALAVLEYEAACLKARATKSAPPASPFQIAEKEDRIEVTVSQALAKASEHATVVSCLVDPVTALEQMGYKLKRSFRPLLDILPQVFEGELVVSAPYPRKLFLFNHPARFLSATVVENCPGGRKLHLVNPQYLLMHYLLGYHSQRSGHPTVMLEIWPSLPDDFFLGRYWKTLDLLNSGADLLHGVLETQMPHRGEGEGKMTSKQCLIEQATAFSLSTQTIGECNYGESQLIIAANDARSAKRDPFDDTFAKLLPKKEELSRLPKRYYPKKELDDAGEEVVKKHAFTPDYDVSWFKWDGGLEE